MAVILNCKRKDLFAFYNDISNRRDERPQSLRWMTLRSIKFFEHLFYCVILFLLLRIHAFGDPVAVDHDH